MSTAKFYIFFFCLSSVSILLGQQEDYFRKYAGPIPGKVHYLTGVNPKEISLKGVDAAKGIIYGAVKWMASFSVWNLSFVVWPSKT